MFEQASRLRLRFETSKGLLSVEDLWDLPLTSARGVRLNEIAKGLNRELKSADEEDFVNKPADGAVNAVLKLKFDLVKHLINTRLAENETVRSAAERKEKKERILQLIAQKQDEQLANKSAEELLDMVNSL
jgi:hypothetical protein